MYPCPRIWAQIAPFAPVSHVSLRVQLRAFSWRWQIPRCQAGAGGYCAQRNDVFEDSRWTHWQRTQIHLLTSSESERVAKSERGSKLVSGMDSLKWIVLGDIALTFVQSAVLRDLPVCFNSAALAKFSWAAEESGLTRRFHYIQAGVSP